MNKTTPTSAAATPPAEQIGTLKQRAFSLGTANAVDYALQFLLPVMLARFLPAEAFGEYRLIWLVIMTVMVIVPMEMPAVLYYFLPRSEAKVKRLHVHQTLFYLACAGALGALAVSSINPMLPVNVENLREAGREIDVLLPLMVLLYAISTFLDTLPTIDERIGWQARTTLSLSLLRSLSLGYAAWATGDLRTLIWLLLGLMTLKIVLLLFYVCRYHGLGGTWIERERFRQQFTHAAPLGLAVALFGLRGQADQWVAATLFSLSSFAAFSIAAVLGPMINMFRQSINYVFLPSMSRLHAECNPQGMVDLNSRANVMVALLVYPLLAFSFIFAEELITLVYTPTYLAAAPVLRVYTLALLAFIIELSSLMLLQRDGAFVLRLNLGLIFGSALLSWMAAERYGLPGAAIGSTIALFVDRIFTLRRISRTTGVPLHRLQNWRALLRLLASALLAAMLAWRFTDTQLAAASTTVRMLAGGGVLLSIYGLLLLVHHHIGYRLPVPLNQQA